MTAPLNILVIGAKGQVARSLIERVAGRADLRAATLGRPAIDLTRSGDLADQIGRAAPDIVINAAAYTAVDRAEADEAAAFAINRDGAGAVAAAAAGLGIPLLHLSTDYVFDGKAGRPYDEGDQVNPLQVYGRSKLAGERAVAEAGGRHLVLRTAWVYSLYGSNFARTMLRLAGERAELRVVDDQKGSPTFAADLADALLALALRVAGPAWRDDFGGLYHLAGAPAMTWCGFARAVVAAAQRRGGPAVPVRAIATADYPTPARRPADSRLDCSRMAERFGLRLPDASEAVDRCVEVILAHVTDKAEERPA
jgi:dTDP-4-dehydrorhamnose reductase